MPRGFNPFCAASASLTITHADDDGLCLLIDEGPYSDCRYAQITLSADQVAALRLWLIP